MKFPRVKELKINENRDWILLCLKEREVLKDQCKAMTSAKQEYVISTQPVWC